LIDILERKALFKKDENNAWHPVNLTI
jgi:hypothetical protein